MEKKTYVCRKLLLYNFLTSRGFKPFKTCADKFNCNRLIWLYTDTPQLQQSVTEYYNTPKDRLVINM